MDLKNFNQRFEIIDDIPRFVSGDNFASSFGLQWNTFRKIQLDSYTGTNMSEDRVKIALPFPIESINGLKVLEVGAGAGRFTEILLKYGANVKLARKLLNRNAEGLKSKHFTKF